MAAEQAPPRVTILLPTHNRADVVGFAIRSVLAQTMGDFELLVVGDGCTDHTAAVVTAFADPRIRWFDLPKAPHFGYANRNLALRQARGEFVAFMAHDDLFLPDHLALTLPCFDDRRVELVYTRPLWIEPGGMIVPSAFNLHHPAMRGAFLARAENQIPASCVVHRRECFARYGYWDDTLPRDGDWDLWARILAGGGEGNFAYLPEPTCLHFRANWRTDENAGPHALQIWRQLRGRQELNPPQLTVPVAEGMTEQESTWRALAADPPGWTRALRQSVHEALDWCVAQAHAILRAIDGDGRIGELEAQHWQLAARNRQLADANANHELQIAALQFAATKQARYIDRIERFPPVRLYRRARRLLG